jgi:hypothetical protein
MTSKIIIDNDDEFEFLVKNQNYAIMSVSYDAESLEIECFKVRGIFKTEQGASDGIKKLYEKDVKKHSGVYPNFYVKVGEWNAIDLDFNNMKDQTKHQDRIDRANILAKEYLFALKNDRKDELQRQNEMKLNKSTVFVSESPEDDVKETENSPELESKDENVREEYNEKALNEIELESDTDEPLDNKYLFADPPVQYKVNKQKYLSISLLSNQSFPSNYKDSCTDKNIVAIKIKCCYENEEDAREKSEYFEKKDPRYDVIFSEIGHWYDIKYAIDNVKTEDGIVYENKEQNTYMKNTPNNSNCDVEKEEEDEEPDISTDGENLNIKMKPQKVILEENVIMENIQQTQKTKETLEEKLEEKQGDIQFLETRIAEMERKFKSLHD